MNSSSSPEHNTSPPSPTSRSSSPISHSAKAVHSTNAEGESESIDVIEYDENDQSIDFTNSRLNELPNLSACKQLTSLTLRSNFLSSGAFNQMNQLTELDLYENRIHSINELTLPSSLISLDLSFNSIKKIEGLNELINLTDLFLVHNKLSILSGFDSLQSLKQLELGSNRLRRIDGLDRLNQLTHLWLGRNKITAIEGLNSLIHLQVLSLPSNRLISLEGMQIPSLKGLKELHLSHNRIADLSPIKALIHLIVLDLSSNIVEQVDSLSEMKELEELWLGNNQLNDWNCLFVCQNMMKLNCIYLEGNPIAKQESNYRVKVKQSLPQLHQIDADQC